MATSYLEDRSKYRANQYAATWSGAELYAVDDKIGRADYVKVKVEAKYATPIESAPSVPKALWAWGKNYTGQLGQGDTTDRSSPDQIGALMGWDDVSGGGGGVAAIISGTLWSWGDNSDGQLGLGDQDLRSVPVQVGSDTDWSTVSMGSGRFAAAIKTDGTLWAWGSGGNGKLGLGDTDDRSSPVKVGLLDDWSSVNCGLSHILATKTDGTLWAWGGNADRDPNFGELGLGDTDNRSSPVKVGLLDDWSSVTCGLSHTAATKTDGTLWSWGANDEGQLGTGNTTWYSSPVQVGLLEDWSQVNGGWYLSGAIKTDGTLWIWGQNNYGQLGQGHISPDKYSSPVQVGLLEDWSSVNCGNMIAAIKTDGTLWTWGRNYSGQLGLGDENDRSSPVQVTHNSEDVTVGWKSVNCGNESMYGLNEEEKPPSP